MSLPAPRRFIGREREANALARVGSSAAAESREAAQHDEQGAQGYIHHERCTLVSLAITIPRRWSPSPPRRGSQDLQRQGGADGGVPGEFPVCTRELPIHCGRSSGRERSSLDSSWQLCPTPVTWTQVYMSTRAALDKHPNGATTVLVALTLTPAPTLPH